MVEPTQKAQDSSHGGIGGLAQLQGKMEFVDDTLTLNEEFKKNVAIPYFKDIYKDLVQWSDNKTKGINKVSILTVSSPTSLPSCSTTVIHYVCLVLATSRHHWRAFLLGA